MSNIVIAGDTSGSVTLQAPAVAGGTVVTLPATTGTAALTSDLLGVGQTWQSFVVTGGSPPRAMNTTYTNTSGKPIVVSVFAVFAYSTSMSLLVDGLQVAYKIESYTNSLTNNVSAIVPNGSTYRVNCAVAASSWMELRA